LCLSKPSSPCPRFGSSQEQTEEVEVEVEEEKPLRAALPLPSYLSQSSITQPLLNKPVAVFRSRPYLDA